MTDDGGVRFPSNLDVKAGRIVGDDARAFRTRSGGIRIAFRIAVPRAGGQPPKRDRSGKPLPYDFFTVVAYGERWLSLLPRLKRGSKVLVMGWTQSRDLDDGRVVVETVAERIAVLDTGSLDHPPPPAEMARIEEE
ncbi:single-stranded DNA-binding protein [Thermoflexus sp.]|uniref:single-stranded DNA-binding protein n=1 Tax=Thermoflexus sp. TaxID=1969742 RepID=UPI002ADD3A0A|nr:single-stranded DNA-binding protein [Thermoflexus sp.]